MGCYCLSCLAGLWLEDTAQFPRFLLNFLCKVRFLHQVSFSGRMDNPDWSQSNHQSSVLPVLSLSQQTSDPDANWATQPATRSLVDTGLQLHAASDAGSMAQSEEYMGPVSLKRGSSEHHTVSRLSSLSVPATFADKHLPAKLSTHWQSATEGKFDSITFPAKFMIIFCPQDHRQCVGPCRCHSVVRICLANRLSLCQHAQTFCGRLESLQLSMSILGR